MVWDFYNPLEVNLNHGLGTLQIDKITGGDQFTVCTKDYGRKMKRWRFARKVVFNYQVIALVLILGPTRGRFHEQTFSGFHRQAQFESQTQISRQASSSLICVNKGSNMATRDRCQEINPSIHAILPLNTKISRKTFFFIHLHTQKI